MTDFRQSSLLIWLRAASPSGTICSGFSWNLCRILALTSSFKFWMLSSRFRISSCSFAICSCFCLLNSSSSSRLAASVMSSFSVHFFWSSSSYSLRNRASSSSSWARLRAFASSIYCLSSCFACSFLARFCATASSFCLRISFSSRHFSSQYCLNCSRTFACLLFSSSIKF